MLYNRTTSKICVKLISVFYTIFQDVCLQKFTKIFCILKLIKTNISLTKNIQNKSLSFGSSGKREKGLKKGKSLEGSCGINTSPSYILLGEDTECSFDVLLDNFLH